MSLPKIDLPLFELTVPSSGKKVKYRPYNVREEKILLVAQESDDLDQTILAIKQIITNCVYDLDVNEIPMFDLEYIMLNIRAKSVNNEIQFNIIDNETDETVTLTLDINDVKLIQNEKHSKKIDLDNGYTLIMKYPTIDKIKDDEDLVINCIDALVSNDGEKVYKLSEYTKEEIEKFIEELNPKNIDSIKEFFKTMPILKVVMPYKDKNGADKTFVLEGLNNFFT
jgi:hypothetical protein